METHARRLASTACLILGVGLALACSSPGDREVYTNPPTGGIGTETGLGSGVCGDAVVDDGEACDWGAEAGNETCGCQADCTWGATGEACSDGDACTTGDACDGLGACSGEAMDCDDDDACTTDSCSDGECVHGPWEGEVDELFDLDELKDSSTLDIEYLELTHVYEDGEPIEVAQISFVSYESEDCEVGKIRLEAYVAMTESGPGLVIGQGSGADPEDVSALAAEGYVVLAYSSPGQGISRGTPNTTDHKADLADDPRDSWYWEDGVAAMRALTVLETWPGTDSSRMGVWGFRDSEVAAGLAAGIDDRVSAVVIEPSYPDLGAQQERFEETMRVSAASPVLVLGDSAEPAGNAELVDLAPEGRLCLDDSAFDPFLEWALVGDLASFPDPDAGSTGGFSVVDTTDESAGGLDWVTYDYQGSGHTFSLSTTPL